MNALTFDQLPNAITILLDEVRDLRRIVAEKINTEPHERFLTIEETAEFLHLSVPTIYSKVSRRTLPAIKRGGRLYFSSTDLTEYLKAGRKKTDAEITASADLILSNKKG